jgi:hypothetical protein
MCSRVKGPKSYFIRYILSKDRVRREGKTKKRKTEPRRAYCEYELQCIVEERGG